MSLDENWFSEPHPASGSAISFRIKEKLHAEKTPFQTIEIYDTTDFGKLMVIDGCVRAAALPRCGSTQPVPVVAHPWRLRGPTIRALSA